MIMNSITKKMVEADKALFERIMGSKQVDEQRPCVTRQMTAEERKRYGIKEDGEDGKH